MEKEEIQDQRRVGQSHRRKSVLAEIWAQKGHRNNQASQEKSETVNA